jgi:hypothetical protein
MAVSGRAAAAGSTSTSLDAAVGVAEVDVLVKLVRLLFAPKLPMLVPWILELKFVAALCAAEIIDEKKLEPGLPLPPGVTSPLSAVGVSGGAVTLESLLGPMVLEADLARRWVLISWRAGEPSESADGLDP